MPKLVSNHEQVLKAIRLLNQSLEIDPILADRLGQAHAFYVDYDDGGEPLFGFSKFVGYADLSPQAYIRQYKSLDGRNTEHALAPWFDEVSPGSKLYAELYGKLASWMGRYGKRPRGGKTQHLRIMVVKPEYKSPAREADDRALLDLLIKVVGMLPTHQRQELRAIM